MVLKYFKLDMDYDDVNDSLFLYIVNSKSKVSVGVDSNLIFDYDDGYMIGFEVLNASEYFNISKEAILNYVFKIKLVVTDDLVKYNIKVLSKSNLLNIISSKRNRLLNEYNLNEGVYIYRNIVDD